MTIYTLKHKVPGYYSNFKILGSFTNRRAAEASRHRKKARVGKVVKKIGPSMADPNIEVITTITEYRIDTLANCCTIETTEIFEEAQVF